MKRTSLLITLIWLTAFLMVACDRDETEPENVSENSPTAAERVRVVEMGQAASEALIQSLGGQLKAALESGGPVQAILVCQQAALPLTTAAGESFEGVAIRRTTLKPRNPANSPDDIDRRVLEMMARAEGEPVPVIEWGDVTARFYRPLMMREVCLNCHGDAATFSPELTKTLSERYPNDLATGYALGDFRGVIRVDVERGEP